MSNEPIDTIGIPEILFDGVTDMHIIEGVARIVLYTRHNGESETVARLAIPISELPEVIQTLVMGLTEAAKVIVRPVLSS